MNLTYDDIQPKSSLTKISTSIAVGAIMCFLLFVLMAKLIENDYSTVAIPPPVVVGPVIMQKEKMITNERQPLPPKQEIIPVPKPMTLDPITEEPGTGTIAFKGVGNPVENLNFGNNISIHNSDRFARPIVRVEPKYPPKAAREGTEGWVELSFTISENGTTQDIQVINAEPLRIFNNAAKRALARWKYQPKLIEGHAVSQPGMRVLLSFSLQE